MSKLSLLAGGWLIYAAAALAAAAPQVTVSTGRLAGIARDGVHIFKGIPYAAPPVGQLRWAPPAAAADWHGTREASRFGPICPQPRRLDGRRLPGYRHRQSEDCLSLNVWAPAHAHHAAVMVWIHGGAFRFGSGESPLYDGTRFAQDGVILVTFNYRLGLLGFFAHPALTRAASPNAPLGNYGSMDQLAALRWVKRNIARFGGDPANVTVFGESAGGSSILYLLATPSARGLFAKAIVESGGGWNIPKPLARMEQQGIAFARRAGLPGANATLAQLRALPVSATFDVRLSLAGIGPFEDGRMIRQTPAQAFADGDAIDVPLIIGSNSYEASLMRIFRIRPQVIVSRLTPAERQLYAVDDGSITELADAVFTDAVMGAPAQWIASKASAGAPSWLYHFSYVASARRGKVPGAAHGAELAYVFATGSAIAARIPFFSLSRKDKAMEHMMHTCWVTFAKTGKPACGGIKWPKFNPKTDELMEFGVRSGVRRDFRAAQYKALDAARLWAGK